MAKIVALFNFKGGVGKTTSAGALGSLFAAVGNRVLMVDLDAQSNLTFSFFDPAGQCNFDRTMVDAFRDRGPVPTVRVSENLFLAPSHLRLILTAVEVNYVNKREYVLADALAPVADRFDLILLDCPPSASVITDNALAVADRVCVPMRPEPYSYYGLKMLDAYIDSCRVLNKGLKIDDIFFTFFDRREKQAREIDRLVCEEYGDVLLENRIRDSVSVSQSVPVHMSVVDAFPQSKVAVDYRNLADELYARMANPRNV